MGATCAAPHCVSEGAAWPQPHPAGGMMTRVAMAVRLLYRWHLRARTNAPPACPRSRRREWKEETLRDVAGIRRQAVIIVATLATAYVASHFFRAANVTIGLDLMRDLRDRAGSAGR